MATIEDAIGLAVEKFRGVQDKGGQPYVLHCLRVMLAQTDDTARQAAVLHDLVEDTDVTIDQLKERGFDQAVIDAIDAMTHREGLSYCEYVLRLSRSPVARRIKLADLHDNYRLDRVAYRLDCQANDARRLQRYILTYQFLSDQLSEADYVQAMANVEQ